MSKSIERLSKGQNNWQTLSVCLPEAAMDIGAIQVPGSDQIMLFGGWSDNAHRTVYFYATADEGRFDCKSELAKGDHFKTNGCFVHTNGQMLFAGVLGFHKYDQQTRSFSAIEMQ